LPLDSKSQSQILNLTQKQCSEIIESKGQIEKGLFIEQSELDKEFNKWLSDRAIRHDRKDKPYTHWNSSVFQ